MASNHFGHFLLTNLLLPLLCETSITQRRTLSDPVRIIVVSSLMHWQGKIELDNLNSERHFEPDKIFSNTKLANLLFAFELSRKLRSEGFINVTVNAAHAGKVQNNLLGHISFHGLIHNFIGGFMHSTHKVSCYLEHYKRQGPPDTTLWQHVFFDLAILTPREIVRIPPSFWGGIGKYPIRVQRYCSTSQRNADRVFPDTTPKWRRYTHYYSENDCPIFVN